MGLCDWSFQKKFIIVCNSFFGKPMSIVIVFHCYYQILTKRVTTWVGGAADNKQISVTVQHIVHYTKD